MASHALNQWLHDQSRELDRLEATHQVMGGRGPGRRWQVQHINDSYIILLAAHFQRFCRDLHTEASSFFAGQLPAPTRVAVQALLVDNRQLDRRNVQPGSLSADFNRFGMDLWGELYRRSHINVMRRARLEQLITWRNAIAHQSFPLPAALQRQVGHSARTLLHIRAWRACCNALAREMDLTVGIHIQKMIGRSPW